MSSKSSASDPLVLPLPHHFPITGERMDKVVLPAGHKFYSRNLGQPWPLATHDSETKMIVCAGVPGGAAGSSRLQGAGAGREAAGSQVLGLDFSSTVVHQYSNTVIQ